MGSSIHLLLLFSFFSLSHALNCTTHSFSNKKQFTSCNDLSALNASLHWNYHPETFTTEIAFRQPVSKSADSSRWVSWAINTNATGMLGAQAIVAFKNANGSLRAYTSPISSYNTHLEEGNLSISVSEVSAAFDGNEMIIFAKIVLPNNKSEVNHLWQEGPLHKDDHVPQVHATSGANVQSKGTVNFDAGNKDEKDEKNSAIGIKMSSMLLIFCLFVSAKYVVFLD